MAELKQQPDYFAEQSVLGALLRPDGDVDREIISTMRADDFIDETDRRYFEAARALYREGAPVDALTVLGKLGLDKDADARAYAAHLMDVTPTTANWREYAAIAHDRAVLSRMQGHALHICTVNSVAECRESVAAINAELTAGRRLRGKTLEELLAEFAQRQAPDHAQKPRHETGFSQIDHLAKLTGGKLCVLAGQPSDGKTALALQWTLKMAASASVGVFSLETDDETLTDRYVTHGFGIDYDHIVDQRLTDLDWVTFADKLPLYARRNLRVFDESTLSAEEIVSVAAALGLKIVVIDYGQLIETERERGSTRAEELARVSKTLKRFALSTDTLVLLLLQLKQPETYKVKVGDAYITKRKAPTMEDIGETRQFEKDADVIFLIYRPDNRGEDNPYLQSLSYDKNRILKIAKNKEGKVGQLTLYFDGLHQTFYVNGQEPGARKPSSRKKQPAGNPGQQTLTELPRSEEEGMPF